MSYQVHKYHNRKSTEQRAVEGFLKALWWLISLPFVLVFGKKKSASGKYQPPKGMDNDYIRNKWREIEELLKLGKPSNNARAVLEADKLLDHILIDLRTPGMTMGERLKASRNRFSYEAYNSAWKGHKVRNELVHNSQFELMDFHARAAIEDFEKAIRELVNI